MTSIVEDVLTILSDYSGGYRLMRARMRGYNGPMPGQRPSHSGITDDEIAREAVVRSTLSRLKKNGLIERSGKIWRISQKGRRFLEKKHLLRTKKKPIPPTTRNMVVIFDIPEKQKSRRDWLRRALVEYGFVLLQKSVWFGPAPLPVDLVDALRSNRLISYIRFFEAHEAEIA